MLSDGGPSEGAADVAEQLTFKEVFYERAAINGHEWALTATTLEVNGPGDEFLSRAGLATNQGGGVGWGDFGHEPLDLAHYGGLAYDGHFVVWTREIAAGGSQFCGLSITGGGLRNGISQTFCGNGPDKGVEGTESEGLDGQGSVVSRNSYDYCGFGVVVLYGPEAIQDCVSGTGEV